MPTSVNREWYDLLTAILNDGEVVTPRGLKTKELIGYSTHVNMARPLLTCVGRVDRKFLTFAFAEAYWILTGDNRVQTIAPYSRMISKFSDDGRYFRGAYGPKIIDQLGYVVDCLSRDPESRQAVLNIWRERPGSSKDVPCTLSAQWFIRDKKLHCVDVMRSSDAWLGWPFDVLNFSMLSHLIILLIRERWEITSEVAGSLPRQLTPGTLTLTAGSQHLYYSNSSQAAEILSTDPPRSVLSANYDDLDPNEFASPDEFISHLATIRDNLVNPILAPWAMNVKYFSEVIDWARKSF